MFSHLPAIFARRSRAPFDLVLRVAAPLLVGGMVLSLAGALFAPPEGQAAGALATGTHLSQTQAPRALSAVVVHPVVAIPVPVAAVVAEPEPEAEPDPEPVVDAGPASWSIGIGAVGLQAELDQCQWVRMDFSAAVPLPVVGAHNYCGGDIVLSMGVGEMVTISGAGLDGTYVVTGSRDAWSDSPAADAIAGMGGDVILQTCYWVNDGSERLVSLQRV